MAGKSTGCLGAGAYFLWLLVFNLPVDVVAAPLKEWLELRYDCVDILCLKLKSCFGGKLK
ncbi:MAG: hypothetical protein EBZ53_06735 [Verrucomicrobia bacterium]|nr:hypothetical protein [Verrucomicrobiota bacterium]